MNPSRPTAFRVIESDQGRVLYDYVLGLYDFLERLVRRYPEFLLEGCSGGGGRFDAGMLYYTPQMVQ
ncbi:MAG: alpha-galactosidase [Eubacterium sp.]